jgi:hypothetical protein
MKRRIAHVIEAETLRPHRRRPAAGARTRRQTAAPAANGLCGLARIAKGERGEQAARRCAELAPVHPRSVSHTGRPA